MFPMMIMFKKILSLALGVKVVAVYSRLIYTPPPTPSVKYKKKKNMYKNKCTIPSLYIFNSKKKRNVVITFS